MVIVEEHEVGVEDHEVGEVNSDGALVVHVSGGKEVYEITKIPLATDSLVEVAKKDIMLALELDNLLTDLNRTSDFLYLAFMAAAGTGELHARVSKRQKEFSDLCGLCVVTTDAMQQGSLAVLERLTQAYSYLLHADEPRALLILSKCSHAADLMSTKCGKLATGLRRFNNNTHRDSELAIISSGDEVRKLRELKELRDGWKANLEAQEKRRNHLIEEIEGLKKNITKEEAREEQAAFRASMLKIVECITDVAGVVFHPFQSIFSNRGSSAPEGNEGSKPSPELLQQQQQQMEGKARAEEALKDAETSEAKALDMKRAADGEVEAAIADKDAKVIQRDEAEGGEGEEVGKAQTALTASYETLDKSRVHQKEAQKDLDLAREKKSEAAAALKKIVDRVNHENEVISRRLQIVSELREKESLRRQAVGQLAELTSRLESNTRQINAVESAQIALEIAYWATDNVIASLSNTEMFWDRMSKFCKHLAASDIIDEITDEKEEIDPAERVEFYKSPDFVRQAIMYLADWTALSSVCAKYSEGSEHTRRSVLIHITASPDEKEARDLIPKLRKKLEEELAREKAEHDEKDKVLKAEAEELARQKAAKRLKDAFDMGGGGE